MLVGRISRPSMVNDRCSRIRPGPEWTHHQCPGVLARRVYPFLFGRSTLQPWFTGQHCVCILVGGANEPYYGSWHEAMHSLLRGLPGYVAGEGVPWRDEKNY